MKRYSYVVRIKRIDRDGELTDILESKIKKEYEERYKGFLDIESAFVSYTVSKHFIIFVEETMNEYAEVMGQPLKIDSKKKEYILKSQYGGIF